MPPEGTLAAFSCRLALVDGYLNHLSELDRRAIHRCRLVAPLFGGGQQLWVIHWMDGETKYQVHDASLLVDRQSRQSKHSLSVCRASVAQSTKAKARYPYNAAEATDLSFNEGDIITVLIKDESG